MYLSDLLGETNKSAEAFNVILKLITYAKISMVFALTELKLYFSKFPGSARKYLNIPEDALVVLYQKDPTEPRLFGADSQSSCCVEVRGGRRMLDVSQYCNVVTTLQPNLSHFMFATPVCVNSFSLSFNSFLLLNKYQC